jgi:hypothetical protein
MKPIRIAAAVLTATIALAGCKNRDEKPIPAPNASWATATSQTTAPPAPGATPSTKGRRDIGDHRGANGISWFQGTIEEAFSTTCRRCASMFRR